MRSRKADRLKVVVYETRVAMGRAAAEAVAERVNALLSQQETVNMVFAAAPSQNEFLAELAEQQIDWRRVNAFHMDEYVGLGRDAAQGFGNFLNERLFSRVPLRAVHYLDGKAKDVAAECARYAGLLEDCPTDIVALGIGENTHLAFNDPHVANFDDPLSVKVVDLDADCRRQQVNDGCFATIEEVPTHALTLTVPALFRAHFVFGIVPGARKADAVRHTLYDEIDARHPSTILRRHPNAVLFLDGESSAKMEKG
ncbi:MAG TPA: 6-phosphogluconolactonase [Puia sp.]|nr:6-phosphogluconolactonase [Puia sp.]